jgi:site-specific recombinase XerD
LSYLAQELPERNSTASRYRSSLKHYVKPKWAECSLDQIKPLAVEGWLKRLSLAPKSKSHFKNLMRVLFNAAMRWELTTYQINPMSLVRVKDGSKRIREPKILSTEEFRKMLEHALGVDLKVQQELLRHADIRTTMNIYTHAVPAALREANSKVVRLVLPPQVA